MGFFDAIDISGSALSAERLRMDVTAENLANAQTTRGANGQPYRRKVVELQQQPEGTTFGAVLNGAMGSAAGPSGVTVAGIAQDSAPCVVRSFTPIGGTVGISAGGRGSW